MYFVFCCTVQYIKRWRSTYIFGWYFVVLFDISKDGAAHIYLDGNLYFVVLFNISKDGATHIYLDCILYFVVVFNISKDGAAHIYLDGILLYCSIYQKMAQHIYIWMVFCCTVRYIKRWRSTYIFGWYFVVAFNISKDGAAHIYLDGILLYCSIYQKMAQHIYIWMVFCCSVQYIKRWRSTYIFGWYFVFCCTVQYIKRWRSTYIFGWYFVVLFDISKDGAAHIYLDGNLYFVVLFNISKDGATHIYLDCILYFVVVFNISKDGAAHIYLDGILLYCSIYQKMAQHIYIWMVFCCTVRYIKRWRSTYIFGWYFVVLFDISKDGAAHIYLDGILLYCSIYQKMADAPILRQPLCTLLYLLDIRIYDINRQLVNVFHILLVLMDVTNDGSKHKLVYLVS